MIKRTKEEILAKCKSIWEKEKNYNDITYDVTVEKDHVTIHVEQMYEFVPLNLAILLDLAKFFGTKNINDDRYAEGGCETCDYGSSYKITLYIKPEDSNA